MSHLEAAYIREILGSIGSNATWNVSVQYSPKDRSGSTPLFYSKQIWLSTDIYNNPLDSYYGKNTLIHESFHQVQYLLKPKGLTMVNGPDAFENLLYEQGLYSINEIDVYIFGDYRKTDLSQYTKLSDIKYYESQAQMIGDFAELYSRAKDGNQLTEKQIKALKDIAIILSNSGFTSKAIQWVKNNIE